MLTDTSKITRIAIEHFMAGRLPPAEDVCRQIIGFEPNNPDALHILGMIAHKNGENDVAINFISKAIQSEPSNYKYHNNAGCIYKALNETEKAIACHQKALEINPDFVNAYVNLGLIYHQKHKFDEAIFYYRQAVAIDPCLAEVFNYLGSVLKSKGKYDEAIACYLQAIEISPINFTALYSLGTLLRDQEQFYEAAACFQKTVAIEPKNVIALIDLGLSLYKLGRFDEAIDCYKKALKINPNSTSAYNNMGLIYYEQGRFEEALVCYQQIVRQEPENGSAQHLIASITGNVTVRAPRQYVEKIFDAYANDFESHLVQKLNYKSHELLTEFIVKFSTPIDRKLDILDLGCGTGLVGKSISSIARQLVGVDLSAKMLAKAEEKHVYSRLIQSDLLAMMQGEAIASYDVIVAADVFIYSGNLYEIMNAVKRLLRIGGLFAFSVETLGKTSDRVLCNQREYILTLAGRYAHSRAYIEKLATSNDFKARKLKLATTRIERGVNVKAWHALWERR
ncbi:MAG TPA: tetratricopeptide repeat protein [Desulfuromonadaceae bacterium]|jgi:predicted TPR repeat methyltransferase